MTSYGWRFRNRAGSEAEPSTPAKNTVTGLYAKILRGVDREAEAEEIEDRLGSESAAPPRPAALAD